MSLLPRLSTGYRDMLGTAGNELGMGWGWAGDRLGTDCSPVQGLTAPGMGNVLD